MTTAVSPTFAVYSLRSSITSTAACARWYARSSSSDPVNARMYSGALFGARIASEVRCSGTEVGLSIVAVGDRDGEED